MGQKRAGGEEAEESAGQGCVAPSGGQVGEIGFIRLEGAVKEEAG